MYGVVQKITNIHNFARNISSILLSIFTEQINRFPNLEEIFFPANFLHDLAVKWEKKITFMRQHIVGNRFGEMKGLHGETSSVSTLFVCGFQVF